MRRSSESAGSSEHGRRTRPQIEFLVPGHVPSAEAEGDGAMFSKLALAAGTAALLAAGSAWGADGFTLKGPPKIAFLYFKAKNDGGWTQAFEEARPKIEAAMGQQIPYVENIA